MPSPYTSEQTILATLATNPTPSGTGLAGGAPIAPIVVPPARYDFRLSSYLQANTITIRIPDAKSGAYTTASVSLPLGFNATAGRSHYIGITLTPSVYSDNAYFNAPGGVKTVGYKAAFTSFYSVADNGTAAFGYTLSDLVSLRVWLSPTVSYTERTPSLSILQLLGILWGLAVGVLIMMRIAYGLLDAYFGCVKLTYPDVLCVLTLGRVRNGIAKPGVLSSSSAVFPAGPGGGGGGPGSPGSGDGGFTQTGSASATGSEKPQSHFAPTLIAAARDLIPSFGNSGLFGVSNPIGTNTGDTHSPPVAQPPRYVPYRSKSSAKPPITGGPPEPITVVTPSAGPEDAAASSSGTGRLLTRAQSQRTAAAMGSQGESATVRANPLSQSSSGGSAQPPGASGTGLSSSSGPSAFSTPRVAGPILIGGDGRPLRGMMAAAPATAAALPATPLSASEPSSSPPASSATPAAAAPAQATAASSSAAGGAPPVPPVAGRTSATASAGRALPTTPPNPASDRGFGTTPAVPAATRGPAAKATFTAAATGASSGAPAASGPAAGAGGGGPAAMAAALAAARAARNTGGGGGPGPAAAPAPGTRR